ncbi:MAG: sensor histidine kinase [Leptolyngbya sp. SIO1E4]|nr:sensor histidine kinase [Leptolyngbya sp. SIO1E4]
MVTLRVLFPILYEPIPYEVSSGDYLNFAVFGILAILSCWFPLRRPMWQRQVYIFLEIGCLIPSRMFSDWGLDPFLYLFLVKSCFLLRRRDVIITAILAGVAWNFSYAWRLMHHLSMPVEQIQERIQADLQAVREVPQLMVIDAIFNNIVIYVPFSLLIILLCLTLISERKSRQQASALAEEVEVLAADLERTRIARDIHDSLGHTLTTLDVQLELAQTLHSANPDRALQALNRAKGLASQSLQEVRRAVSAMRQGKFNLSAELEILVEQMNQAQTFRIEAQIDLPQLPQQVSQQLYLIVKEGLTNIQKHSQASAVNFWAHMTSEGISLGLADDGIGFEDQLSSTGFGLRGMKERVQMLKGQMKIHSTHGKGTLIQVTIPR